MSEQQEKEYLITEGQLKLLIYARYKEVPQDQDDELHALISPVIKSIRSRPVAPCEAGSAGRVLEELERRCKAQTIPKEQRWGPGQCREWDLVLSWIEELRREHGRER